MTVQNIVLIAISLIISVVNSVASHNFEGFVVEGERAQITDFPHSAYLFIECWIGYTSFYACGSSILNQATILTAAHCLEQCIVESTYLTAHVGHALGKRGSPYFVSSYKIHEDYDKKEISSDIALVRLETNLKFGTNVRRVALMRKPPNQKRGEVAGWGYTDERTRIQSDYLMQVIQKVRTRPKCIDMLNRIIPVGTICGGSKRSKRYIAPGDSGSALVVLKYIQIGIVSYKDLSRSKSVCIYTDVAYFYDWVKTNSRNIYCQGEF